ncbi:MAG: hypothetical protein AVDCRST_MAG68-3772, partial [uncultured Gemmatimonadetes bacterium]
GLEVPHPFLCSPLRPRRLRRCLGLGADPRRVPGDHPHGHRERRHDGLPEGRRVAEHHAERGRHHHGPPLRAGRRGADRREHGRALDRPRRHGAIRAERGHLCARRALFGPRRTPAGRPLLWRHTGAGPALQV